MVNILISCPIIYRKPPEDPLLKQEEMSNEDDEPADDEDVKPNYSAPSSGSESSVDLADVEFDFTPEERRAIRRKRKQERLQVKQNQLMLKRTREAELALAKRKEDRFFDKSRIIPSEIYFGDIVVPLHVLHTYGQDDQRKAKAARTASTSTAASHSTK